MERMYVKRILECVELIVKDGSEPSMEAFEKKYNLPRISEDSLNRESDESLKKITDALSEKNPVYKTYIQTGARSKMVNITPTQVGHGNQNGSSNKTKETALEEDCNVKLEKAQVEIKYLKKIVEEKDKEINNKDALIGELIKKIIN